MRIIKSEKNAAPPTKHKRRGEGGEQPRRTRTRVASVSLHTSPHTQHTDHNNSQFLNRPNRNWLNNCAFSRILTSGQQYRSFSTFFVAKFGSQSSDVFAEFVLIIFSGMIFCKWFKCEWEDLTFVHCHHKQ